MQKLGSSDSNDPGISDCVIEVDVVPDTLEHIEYLLEQVDETSHRVRVTRECENNTAYEDYTPRFAMSTADALCQMLLRKMQQPGLTDDTLDALEASKIRRIFESIHQFAIAVLESKRDVYQQNEFASEFETFNAIQNIDQLIDVHRNILSAVQDDDFDIDSFESTKKALNTSHSTADDEYDTSMNSVDAYGLTENPFANESAPTSVDSDAATESESSTEDESTTDDTDDDAANNISATESETVNIDVRSRQLDPDSEPVSPYASDDVSESDVTFDSDDDRNTDDMIRKILSEMKDDFDADEFDIESIIDDVESEMDQSTDDSDTDTSERDS
jgi:hypothetical protein